MMILSALLIILFTTNNVVSLSLDRKPMEGKESYQNSRSPMWQKVVGSESIHTHKLDLIFAIKQQNRALIEQKLLEISTPSSSQYGKHLTLDEVNELTQPSIEAQNTVKQFLNEYGIINGDFSYSSGFLKVKVTVEQAQSILGTTYHTYANAKSGEKIIRCESYTLPINVANVVDFVAPTINFPISSIKPVTFDAPLSSNTPDSLRTLYSVGTVQGSQNKNARQAVTAFLDQYYEENDLQTFYNTYYQTLSGVPIYNVIGPNGKKGGVEAALDVEYMTTLGSGVPTEFWSFAGSQPGNDQNEPFLDWLYLLGNTTNPPLVFSTSYGEDEVSVSYDYAERMNEEFIEAGLRGITIIFASGDSGVGSAFGSCTTFTPQFPSDSPYVTAVGATTNFSPEVAAGLSSGGFSNRWAQPSWQANAVSTYFKTASKLPSSALYNSSGRGFPDVSAQGTGYVVLNNGVIYGSVAGTSCSSPVFGGIIALVNDARIKSGKSPLGFLNPFIYSNADLFTDVTSGNNPGCGTTGFYASAGWDPVTGFGTPNYNKLVAAALALP
eukprot:gene9117-12298_t